MKRTSVKDAEEPGPGLKQEAAQAFENANLEQDEAAMISACMTDQTTGNSDGRRGTQDVATGWE